MSLEVYRNFTETYQWRVLWVEIFLVGSALMVMTLHFLLGKEMRKLIPGFATMLLGILTMIFIGVMLYGIPSGLWFSGMIARDEFTNGLRLLLLIASFFVCLLSMVFFANRSLLKVEFYAMLLIVTACMSLLVQSNHMLMFFVSLELVTVGYYVLISYPSNRGFVSQAGKKHLICGSLSSVILLLGIVLIYVSIEGSSNNLGSLDGFDFADIHTFFSEYSETFWTKVGASLLLAGLFFKMGLFPFHFWVPDVYQLAPTPVTALLAVSSKGLGFALLLLLFRTGGALAPLGDEFIPLFSVIAGSSILWGNLSALGERNVKRLIGFSGIAHSGYLLLGIIASICLLDRGLITSMIFFYLSSYLFATFAIFGVMVHWGGAEDVDQQREHYVNLAKDNPFFGLIMLTGLCSLSGVPPTAGFVAKFLLFMVIFQAELWALLGIATLGVVISVYYYFAWIREAFFKPSHAYYSPKDKKWISPGSLFKAFWMGIVSLLFLFGVYQGDWLKRVGNSQIPMDSQKRVGESSVFLSN